MASLPPLLVRVLISALGQKSCAHGEYFHVFLSQGSRSTPKLGQIGPKVRPLKSNFESGNFENIIYQYILAPLESKIQCTLNFLKSQISYFLGPI